MSDYYCIVRIKMLDVETLEQAREFVHRMIIGADIWDASGRIVVEGKIEDTFQLSDADGDGIVDWRSDRSKQ